MQSDSDQRPICFVAGPSSLGATDAVGEGSIANGPMLILPYFIAKASPTVATIVEMLDAAAADGGGADDFAALMASEGLGGDDEGAGEGGASGAPTKDAAQQQHTIRIDIAGPLAPTQKVLNVIGSYLQMSHRRTFTEVPKPVRESVLETLRPEEARFLRDQILSVDGDGDPSDGGLAAVVVAAGGAEHQQPLSAVSTASPEAGVGGGSSFAGAAGSPSAGGAAHQHLFKLKVLRVALFLQLSPLAAAISGWFAHEMTKLVSNEAKATRNAERLRGFLGVESDFTEDEKVIIERHTTWPGRN